MQRGTKDLLTVVRAHEGRDDVPRERASDVVQAEARLHRVHDHRTNLDGLASLRSLRHSHPGFAECAHGAQPPTVISTSTAADHRVSSFITAIACTCWEIATRIRVVTRARPLYGPSSTSNTLGCGLLSANRWMRLT